MRKYKGNKQAVRDYQARKIKEDPLYTRRIWLKHRYGISIEDYNKMLIDQNGLCEICNLTMEEKDICIDHCHSTKKVRGLLHRTCNAAIGLLKEDVSILANAITYLNKNK